MTESVGPRHAEVRDVGRALRQHALVRGLHVAMRADHRGDPSVEVPAHGLRLAGGLHVHVHDDDRRVLAELGHELVGLLERAVDRQHEHPPHRFSTATLCGPAFTVTYPTPGRARGEVGRAEKEVLLSDVLDDLLLVPDVIARGHHVHAVLEEGPRDERGDAEARRRVLHVDDGQVGLVLLAQAREERVHGLAPRLAEDVADTDDGERLGPESSRLTWPPRRRASRGSRSP